MSYVFNEKLSETDLKIKSNIDLCLQLQKSGHPFKALQIIGDERPENIELLSVWNFVKAKTHALSGDLASASEWYSECITFTNTRPAGFAAQAGYLAAKGNILTASQYFAMALNEDYLPRKDVTDAAQKGQDWEKYDKLYLDAHPWLEPYKDDVLKAFHMGFQLTTDVGSRIYQRDPLFGPYQNGLTSLQEGLIESILSQHWNSANDLSSVPAGRNIYKQFPQRRADGLKLLIAMPRNHRIALENDEAEYSQATFLKKAAQSVGFSTHQVEIPYYDRFSTFDAELASLQKSVDEFQPDLILMDGLFTYNINKFNKKDLLKKIAQSCSAKIAIYDPDPHETQPNTIKRSMEIADVVFHMKVFGDGIFAAPYKNSPRRQLMAGNPLPPSPFSAASDREHDIFFVGDMRRHRMAFLEVLEEEFPNSFIRFRYKQNDVPTTAQYSSALNNSKIVVNSGHEHGIEVSTGRTTEAIAAGCLLIEFDSWLPAFCYQPFIHYIPAANLDQMVQYSRFFLKHPHWRDKIAKAALDFMNEHYHPDMLWGQLLARLDMGQEV